jgi:hypothetical protein
MKIMTSHSSATALDEAPHETETTTIITVSEATKRRAEAVMNDRTIDPQWRTIIRAALELNDPWLAELVTRAEAGEDIVDTFESMRTIEAHEGDSRLGRIEALAEIICRSGDESTAALFILMETLESSTRPKVFASRAKHVAFSGCGDLHVYEMVDAQIAVVEDELLASNTVVS